MIAMLVALALLGYVLMLVAWPRPRPLWLRALFADTTGGNRSALKPISGQQNIARQLNLSFTGQGASVPLNAEGDPGALWVTITRQGVGQYTIKTVDPWQAIVTADANLGVATIAAAWSTTFGKPSQNADNTWSITLQTFSGGAAADVILNDVLMVQLHLRDSVLTP